MMSMVGRSRMGARVKGHAGLLPRQKAVAARTFISAVLQKSGDAALIGLCDAE
jgi:hypothetical protein